MSSPTQEAKCADTKDSLNPTGICPLKLDKIQLIPLRYGLVENLSIDGHFPTPYQTKSKPMGIRLLRDGWLYILVENNDTWILHEYKVEGGILKSLLWQGGEASQDVRTSPVGDANLVLDKDDNFYACYSEIQWTARKCSQVIKNDLDRNRFMQKINLSGVDPIKGGKHILSSEQASSFIAECAEKPDTKESESNLAYKAYEWEHKPLYRQTEFSTLSAKVLPQYKNDHFYLILNDDIGVLRDLASYQALVATSLEMWRNNEKHFQKYSEASFIESQITLTPKTLDSLAVALGDESFATNLNAEQKQSIIDWFEYQENPDYGHGPGPSPSDIQKQKLAKTLGSDLWCKYGELIDEIEEQYQRQVEGVSGWRLWDANKGTLGILDVIKEDEMNAFLVEERKKLAHWHSLLNVITEDRTSLFVRFYTSAWYFDPTSSIQLEHFLSSQYGCIQDICWDEQSSSLVAKKLDEIPWISYSTISLLETKRQDEIIDDLAKHVNRIQLILNGKDTLTQLNDIGLQVNGLVDSIFGGEKWGQTLIDLDEKLSGFDSANKSSLAQGHTLALARNINNQLVDASNKQQVDPNAVFKDLNNATSLEIIKAYRLNGISIEVSTIDEIASYNQNSEKAADLAKEKTALKHKIREKTKALRNKGRNINQSIEINDLKSKLKATSQKLEPITTRLQRAISPIGDSSMRVGYKLAGLSPDHIADFNAYVKDQEKIKASGFKVSADKSIRVSAGKWDVLSLVIAGLATYNALKTIESTNEKSDLSLFDVYRDASGALGAIFGFVQGVTAATGEAAIKLVKTEAGKLIYHTQVGKWTTILGGIAYAFSGINAAAKSYEAFNEWEDAKKRGDKRGELKAIVNMSAESSMVALNAYGLGRSMHVGVTAILASDKIARSTIWAQRGGRLLTLGLRINLIGIAVTALQLGFSIWYNRTSLTDYLTWFKNSQWGTQPTSRGLENSNLQLARIAAKPKAEIVELSNGKSLVLHFPNISDVDLNLADVFLSAYWKTNSTNNDWALWTEALEQQWVHLSQPNEPLMLGLPIYPRESNAQHGVAIEIHYLPTPDAKQKDVVKFQAETLNRVGSLNEVTVFKARNTPQSNLARLTTQHIIMATD